MSGSPEQKLSQLKTDYGIEHKLHPNDNRVILNYSQIYSPKYNEFVRECRGLVLDKSDWSLVARSFYRFFNLGESQTEDLIFDWDNSVCTFKEDGSLAILYHYNGQWHVNTRASFADSNVNDADFTWKDLFLKAFDYNKHNLNVDYTYVFELCSPYNKIVKVYREPQVFLLSVFNKYDELKWDSVVDIANKLGIKTPLTIPFNDIEAVKSEIKRLSSEDATFEGVVVRDVNNSRLKIKSAVYVELHRLHNNGNLTSIKSLIPLIVSGEIDEVLTYFPELIVTIDNLNLKIKAIVDEVLDTWHKFKDVDSQKDFAVGIQSCTKYCAPLFNARKTGQSPVSFITEDFLVKNIKD